MSTAPRHIAPPTPASTHPRNTLRLLTLAAMILVILFKQPEGQEALEQPVLAQAGQVSSTETE